MFTSHLSEPLITLRVTDESMWTLSFVLFEKLQIRLTSVGATGSTGEFMYRCYHLYYR